ncbi:hypothetical protein F5I97DRAFT_1800279 [Phlebopus sp. FC_14]|nr:hypothetical protein F5I97DRAFT_1800279 [Phlebopus sp. FC_14]
MHSLFTAFLLVQFGTGSYAHPTSPQRRRQVPEIDGSQGGFIGLVVALSILILICCIGVFYLLQNHEPTDQERAARRERYHRQRERYDSASSIPSALGSFKEKIKRMWASTKESGDGSGGLSGSRRRGGRGWIQAGSGDEWESDSDRGDPELVGGIAPAVVAAAAAATGPVSVDNDNARVVDSPLSDTGSSFIPVHYTDPFSKDSPTSHMSPIGMTAERSQSPLSTGSPREEGSTIEEDEDDHDLPAHHHHQQHLSTMSNTSVRTAVGSRFVETL